MTDIVERNSHTDPTKLTTDQITREIGALKDLLEVSIENAKIDIAALFRIQHDVPSKISEEVDHLRDLTNARLSGADVVTKILQAGLDKLPSQTDEKISALANIHNEKFSSIQKQFAERDVRTEQSSKDSKVAVDAALQAAKEAVGEQNKSSSLAIAKSETATNKQIEQIGQAMASAAKNADDKFSDMKDRLALIEGRGTGSKDLWGYLVAAAGIALAWFMAIHK